MALERRKSFVYPDDDDGDDDEDSVDEDFQPDVSVDEDFQDASFQTDLKEAARKGRISLPRY